MWFNMFSTFNVIPCNVFCSDFSQCRVAISHEELLIVMAFLRLGAATVLAAATFGSNELPERCRQELCSVGWSWSGASQKPRNNSGDCSLCLF